MHLKDHMKRSAIFLSMVAYAAFSFAQGVGGNGVPGQSIGNGVAGVITGLAYSQSDTTVVATWYTTNPSNSTLFCGGKAAVDNNVQAEATYHQAIVVGLTASTPYSCYVQSGAVASSTSTVTTNAAQTRTPITAVQMGPATLTSATAGDTMYNCVSNDNVTYVDQDDGTGFSSANAGANQQIDKLTTEATLLGSTVNLMTNFGFDNTTNGSDGPSGVPLSDKLNGMWCMGGQLYSFHSRVKYGSSGVAQLQIGGDIIRSADHGLTWNSWQNPQAFLANGTPPNPLGTFMFATANYSLCSPVMYGIDDGSLGYLLPANRIDGGDGFVYGSCTDGQWNNSSNLYMWRIPRALFSTQNPGNVQYWHGPTSPAATDFVNDTNWTSSATSATSIYNHSGQVSAQDIVFVPAINSYLLLEWYQPSTGVPGNTNWVISAGTTPAGPWTSVGTFSWNSTSTAYYNPIVLHRASATNTNAAQTLLQLLFTGDYGNPSAYHPGYATMNVLTSTSNIYYTGNQCNAQGGSSAATISCVVTVANTGDAVNVFTGRFSGTGTYSSATASCGTVSQLSNRSISYGAASILYDLYIPNATAGSCTITVTLSTASGFPYLAATDWANPNTTTPIDNASCTTTPFCSNPGSVTSGTPGLLVNPSITTANANEVVLCFGNGSQGVLSAGTGYVPISLATSGVNFYQQFSSQATAGTYTPSPFNMFGFSSSAYVTSCVALTK